MIRPDFSTDPWMGKVHLAERYNCFDFCRDVWLDATGEDIGDRLSILRTPIRDRKVSMADVRAFEKLDRPAEPCLVIMHNPRATPHVGIYLRRRVLHLTDQFGALMQRLHVATHGYRRVALYR